ncbi:MAG: nicotinate (nicotinamide) nucleotide adenylyltransferase [Ruminococcaceae bacterium]|nr:nicotinate (nicotinamide) nucleotide adenylyltransferase [Oscillospiraceae bacterium]
MKRVALYGGVFDPVHSGHVAVAEQILTELKPDELFLIPCGNPPHKKGRRISDGYHRAQMLRIATQSMKKVFVSDYEIARTETSYTVHTLEHFKKKYGQDTELIWVIGADNIKPFFSWYQPKRILELATIAVLARPGFNRKDAQTAFPDCYIIGQKQINVSSTQIRENCKIGKSITGLVPPSVEEYIKEHSLYPPTITIAQAEQLVKERLREHRCLHTFGVRKEAVRLAKRFGADEEKMALAALLHDITKQISLEEQLALCKQYQIIPDQMQKESTALLHSITAEAVAFYQLGIDDNEILSAIRYHTTGCADMNLFIKIIYLADCIEPNREEYPGLSEIRSLAWENLDKAVLASMERGLIHLKETGKPIHPDTISAIESLKGEIT